MYAGRTRARGTLGGLLGSGSYCKVVADKMRYSMQGDSDEKYMALKNDKFGFWIPCCYYSEFYLDWKENG